MKSFTIYQIQFGKKPLSFLILADNDIPFVIMSREFDIDDSVVYESFKTNEEAKLIKSIVNNNEKSILNLNNDNISDIIRRTIGYKVTWKRYSLGKWNSFIQGLVEYSGCENYRIEMEHPIDLNNDMISGMVSSGLETRISIIDNIQSILKRNKRWKN